MSGFFSSKMANKLTNGSLHFVDWSRVGELLASGRHHYTWQQLLQRGVVVGGMAVGAYQGTLYAEDHDSTLTASLYGMAGCFVGFVVSHIAVIAPLIYKRAEMWQYCHAVEFRITQLVIQLQTIDPGNDQLKLLGERVLAYRDSVMELSLSNETSAKASQTWGRRVALMNQLLEDFTSDLTILSTTKNLVTVLSDKLSFWTEQYDALQQSYLCDKSTPTH